MLLNMSGSSDVLYVSGSISRCRLLSGKKKFLIQQMLVLSQNIVDSVNVKLNIIVLFGKIVMWSSMLCVISVVNSSVWLVLFILDVVDVGIGMVGMFVMSGVVFWWCECQFVMVRLLYRNVVRVYSIIFMFEVYIRFFFCDGFFCLVLLCFWVLLFIVFYV